MAVTDATVTATVKNDISWLQKHERLILGTLLLLTLLWVGNKYLDNSANNDRTKAALLEQQLTTAKANSAQIASQNAQIASQYQAMIQQLSDQNNRLAAAVAQRNANLTTQQTTNKTLPLTDLAKRWETLAVIQPDDLTATDAGITVNDTAARATVNLLEEVPALQGNLADETQIAQNTKQELDKADDVIGGLNKQVSGLNDQIGLEQTTCKAEIASNNANARKSKRNWFLRGAAVGAGIVGYLVLHF
jgi:hypothetical protein